MEHLPPPPAPGSTPVPPPPSGYPAPAQPSYYQQAAPIPTRRPGIIKRSMRFLLRRTMYTGIMLGRMFAPFKLALLVIIPLVVIVGALTTALLWERLAGPPVEVARVDSLPPALEVEAFLEGQQTYDAEKMWNAFSTSYKAQLTNNGVSATELKESVQNERMEGRSYLRPVYVGGVSLKSGGAIYFYMITASVPSTNSMSAAAFIFTVDTTGKIMGVDVD